MSLTSLIRNKTPVRERLADAFPKPKLPLKAELLVPAISDNRALIGAAYDYLLRFHLIRDVPFARSERWVAELALESLRKRSPQSAVMIGEDWYAAGDVEWRISGIIETALDELDKFCDGGACGKPLLTAALELAHCDVLYRIGRLDARILEKPRADEIGELRQLISHTDLTRFRATQRCLLNPDFGVGSDRIGGADADLLIDDALIDVKCVVGLRLRIEDWRQLIGYAALNRHFPIGGGRTPVPIRRIGVYFARHGYLAVWPLRHLVDAKQFSRFADWLAEYATERQIARQENLARRHSRAAAQLRLERRDRKSANAARAAKERNEARRTPKLRPSRTIENARKRFRPDHIDWLFIAEAPPASPDRFFYFEQVVSGDSLFLELMRALYPDAARTQVARLRSDKSIFLKRFYTDSNYLIDACDVPIDPHSSKRSQLLVGLPSLERKLEILRRDGCLHAETKIVLVGCLVHAVCYERLFDAGFNVVNSKAIEFPAFHHQKTFRKKLRSLVRSLERGKKG